MSLVFNMSGGGGGGSIKLSSIAITTKPATTAYKAGASFSTSGMVVTATYSNGATKVVTDYSYSPSGALTVDDTKITLTYSEGGITATTTQAISVTRTALTVPSQSGTLTYSGSAKTPSWSNYDSSKMTLGGTTSGTNAGSYTATFTLKDTSLYCWSDSSTGVKSVSWSIGKAAGSLSISKTSITLNSSTKSTTFTVTRAGDGAITVTSSNTSVVTVSLSGTTVTVNSVNNTAGSATITVKVAASTNYTAPSNATCAVTASFVVVMPDKGDIINLDLDGNGNKQYRVLNVSGTTAKVVAMYDTLSSVYNSTSTTTTMGSYTVQKYSGSTLDTYLNSTWYNTLSSTAKAAIVPESVVQYGYYYYDEPNTPNTPTYTYQYQYNWSNSDYDNANRIGSETVGSRYVFALDLKDIFDYFGKVCITSNELMTLFWNTTSSVSKYIWLRSAYAGISYYAWGVGGRGGGLLSYSAADSDVVRPALNLDLSKISYSA